MSYVIDASVVVKVLVREAGSTEASAVMMHPLIAPDLLVAECLNALRGKVLARQLGSEQALLAAEALHRSPITFEPSQPHASRSLSLSLQLSLSVYDCVYLALAEAHGLPFITADERLVARCRQSDAAGLPVRVWSLYESLPTQVQERAFRRYMARRRAA
jgi:predicted nucleic acid-binding protein